MAEFKEVTCTVERLINLGNYENVKFGCTVTVVVEEGPHMSDTTRDEAWAEGLAFAKDKVGKELARFTPVKKG